MKNGRNTSPIGFVKLHRIHAAAQATRVEFNAPDVSITWRGEGNKGELKPAMAFRLAVCWNVLEGIPTAALMDGVLRDIFSAIDEGDIAKARALVERFDRSIDMTNGRPHDCAGCLNDQQANTEEQHEGDH